MSCDLPQLLDDILNEVQNNSFQPPTEKTEPKTDTAKDVNSINAVAEFCGYLNKKKKNEGIDQCLPDLINIKDFYENFKETGCGDFLSVYRKDESNISQEATTVGSSSDSTPFAYVNDILAGLALIDQSNNKVTNLFESENLKVTVADAWANKMLNSPTSLNETPNNNDGDTCNTSAYCSHNSEDSVIWPSKGDTSSNEESVSKGKKVNRDIDTCNTIEYSVHNSEDSVGCPKGDKSHPEVIASEENKTVISVSEINKCLSNKEETVDSSSKSNKFHSYMNIFTSENKADTPCKKMKKVPNRGNMTSNDKVGFSNYEVKSVGASKGEVNTLSNREIDSLRMYKILGWTLNDETKRRRRRTNKVDISSNDVRNTASNNKTTTCHEDLKDTVVSSSKDISHFMTNMTTSAKKKLITKCKKYVPPKTTKNEVNSSGVKKSNDRNIKLEVRDDSAFKSDKSHPERETNRLSQVTITFPTNHNVMEELKNELLKKKNSKQDAISVINSVDKLKAFNSNDPKLKSLLIEIVGSVNTMLKEPIYNETRQHNKDEDVLEKLSSRMCNRTDPKSIIKEKASEGNFEDDSQKINRKRPRYNQKQNIPDSSSEECIDFMKKKKLTSVKTFPSVEYLKNCREISEKSSSKEFVGIASTVEEEEKASQSISVSETSSSKKSSNSIASTVITKETATQTDVEMDSKETETLNNFREHNISNFLCKERKMSGLEEFKIRSLEKLQKCIDKVNVFHELQSVSQGPSRININTLNKNLYEKQNDENNSNNNFDRFKQDTLIDFLDKLDTDKSNNSFYYGNAFASERNHDPGKYIETWTHHDFKNKMANKVREKILELERCQYNEDKKEIHEESRKRIEEVLLNN